MSPAENLLARCRDMAIRWFVRRAATFGLRRTTKENTASRSRIITHCELARFPESFPMSLDIWASILLSCVEYSSID